MTRRTIVASALALSLAGASTATAQVIVQEQETVIVRPGAPGLVPPHEILTIVRSAGFNPLERPTRRGVTYALHAVASDGWHVRLIVDARTGEILSATQLRRRLERGPGLASGPSGPAARPPRYLAPDFGPDRPGGSPMDPIYEDDPPGGMEPRPPGAVPSAPVVGVPRELGPTPRIVAPEPGPGALPPPPERFPNRAQPGAEPRPAAPVRRTVSAALPKAPPLPRPRPALTPVSAPAASAAPSPAPAGEPQIPAPEAKTPEAKSPEAKSPEAKSPEAKAPAAKAPVPRPRSPADLLPH